MKKVIFALVFFLSSFSTGLMADSTFNPYAFVENFELVSIQMEAKEALITIRHDSFDEPRMELIPGQACLESYPAKCSATLVRLDDSVQSGELKELTLRVDLSKIFYDEGVVVTVFGPKGATLKAIY